MILGLTRLGCLCFIPGLLPIFFAAIGGSEPALVRTAARWVELNVHRQDKLAGELHAVRFKLQ